MLKNNVIKGIIVGSVAIGLGGTTFAAANQNKPRLKNSEITLEAGTSEADLLKKIKADSSDVDIIQLLSTYEKNKLGIQNLQVNLSDDNGKTNKTTVAIKVVDTTAPVISAKSSYTVNIDENFDLKSVVKATDNATLAPEISVSKYKKEVGKQEVSIMATDDSSNVAVKEITLHFVDTTAPKISGDNITVNQGDSVNLLSGISATDNIDGDLTSAVKAESTIDTNIAGTNSIKYTVADKSGNVGQYTRTITVESPSSTSATAGIAFTSNTASVNTPMTLNINGTVVNYQNGGMSAGQSIIDANPYSLASTWGGAAVQSSTDGLNTHFVGHNPGLFGVLFNLSGGEIIAVTDNNGVTGNYQVGSIFQVNDSAIGTADGVDYWDTITGTGGGERITLQTCVNDDINLIVIAYLV